VRSNQEDTNAFNTLLKSGRFSHDRKVLTGDVVITKNGPLVNFLDPNGADRNVVLPALEGGRFYVVGNVGTAQRLVVQSANSLTITTLLPGDVALLCASDAEWIALRGWAALGVFTNTVNGLVPAPVSVTPGSLFLRDDGQWGQVQVTGIVDAFKFITDGTTIAVGAGPDTFRLRSSTGKIGITVQNNDATFGDNANFTVNEGSVNHNALLNYVADQHVAHSGVVINPGTGMSGGGDITASRTLTFTPHSLTVNAAPALTDYAVMDLAAGGPRTTLFSSLNALFIHNNLAGYVANEHINHTGVSIVPGSGISGGGDITTSRTVSLDINGLTAANPATTDSFPYFNAAAPGNRKVSLAVLTGLIDHNSLLNYVANQHIDHTTVSISAGTGLTGGGTIAATRSLSLANIANNTVLGNVSGSAAAPIALTQTQVTALINAATTTLSGAVPAPGTATGKVLRDDMTWVTPAAATSTLVPPQGRLTLVTATPVMTTTQSAKTTVFYTPYTGNIVPLYDGTNMVPTAVAEISVATTDTTKNPAAIGASKVNDWFVWNDAGTIRLSHGPDWTSDTARSAGTALVMVNGILLNNVGITNGPAASRGTYVGTTRSNASSQIDFIIGGTGAGGVAVFIGLWNAYNRVTQGFASQDSTASWTYNSTTIRNMNASANNRISFVRGLNEDGAEVTLQASTSTGASGDILLGIGLDATVLTISNYISTSGGGTAAVYVSYKGQPGLGFHFLQATEKEVTTTNASSMFGVTATAQNESLSAMLTY
jgi:hypothetical protein